MLPKDFTPQEQIVAECLSEMGLRYSQQVEIDKYTVDFLVEESIILEADGFFGHYRRADKIRDETLLNNGEYTIIHIKSKTKKEIKNEIEQYLCQ